MTMLKVSKLADYATGIMSFLAGSPEALFSAAELARQLHMGIPTVSKILKLLLEAELLSSVRGVKGGYQLARPATAISLIAIITAIDGYPALTECSHLRVCKQDATCTMKHNWRLVNRLMVHLLEKLTLADMSLPLTEHPLVATILGITTPQIEG